MTANWSNCSSRCVEIGFIRRGERRRGPMIRGIVIGWSSTNSHRQVENSLSISADVWSNVAICSSLRLPFQVFYLPKLVCFSTMSIKRWLVISRWIRFRLVRSHLFVRVALRFHCAKRNIDCPLLFPSGAEEWSKRRAQSADLSSVPPKCTAASVAPSRHFNWLPLNAEQRTYRSWSSFDVKRNSIEPFDLVVDDEYQCIFSLDIRQSLGHPMTSQCHATRPRHFNPSVEQVRMTNLSHLITTIPYAKSICFLVVLICSRLCLYSIQGRLQDEQIRPFAQHTCRLTWWDGPDVH